MSDSGQSEIRLGQSRISHWTRPMSNYERFFHKNLYLSLERHYTRILDGEDDSEGEGEGVTSVSQKKQVRP